MDTLWLSAVLFPSSEQEHCGTKTVTFTCSSWANSVASCLFRVDKPPLDESHSLANRVTLNAVSDFPWLSFAGASCVVGTLAEGLKSYKRTTPTIKAGLQIKQSGFETWQGHCVVFMGDTLCSHSLSLHPSVWMYTILRITNFMLWVTLHWVSILQGEVKIHLLLNATGN